MIVVKLNGGGLLLYAPVKERMNEWRISLHAMQNTKYFNLQVHKDVSHLLCSWLESLGPVQWLVCASSFPTLLIHDAIKAFPDAKVVGPGTKFNSSNILPSVVTDD